MNQNRPNLLATNAFFYYQDLDKAWNFYRHDLGFKTSADYGFAKIMRLSRSSYLTLVDSKFGMHQPNEPKSVALALVTNQVEGWYQYLTEKQVPFHKKYQTETGRAHDGFVVLDPEGYFLEFERFNPHPENTALIPILSKLKPIQVGSSARPEGLDVIATVLWLYYRDLKPMQEFYEALLDVELLVDQGWAKVYRVVGSGFIGLVDGEKGLHQVSEDKCVTVSFFTTDINGWFSRAKKSSSFRLRTQDLTDESGQVTLFVGCDPEGYFLEWDVFKPTAENRLLNQQLGASS